MILTGLTETASLEKSRMNYVAWTFLTWTNMFWLVSLVNSKGGKYFDLKNLT